MVALVEDDHVNTAALAQSVRFLDELLRVARRDDAVDLEVR